MNIPKLLFRSWYYFRTGWSTYFAFIMAGINTLTVTYYLAIEKYPPLIAVFPNFMIYVLSAIIIAAPVLTLTGYIHYKKSNVYKAEADLGMEINPYNRRLLLNTEMMLPIFLQMSGILTKLAKNEKITDKESEELVNLQNDLSQYIDLKHDKRYAGLIGADIEQLKNNEAKMK